MKDKNYLAHIVMPFKHDISSDILREPLSNVILDTLKNGLPNHIQADFNFTECMVEGNAFYDSMENAEWEPLLTRLDQLPEGTKQIQIFAVYDILEDSEAPDHTKRGDIRVSCLDEQNEPIAWDFDQEWVEEFHQRFANHVPYSCSEKVPFHYVQRMLIGHDMKSDIVKAIVLDQLSITTPSEQFKNPNLLFTTEGVDDV